LTLSRHAHPDHREWDVVGYLACVPKEETTGGSASHEPDASELDASELDASELDALVAELRARVAKRTEDGTYSVGLEESLDDHFERLVGRRPTASPALYDEIREALNELENFVYTRGKIDPGSDIAGGQALHRVIGKIVSRQVQGILEQSQAHAHIIARTVGLLAEITSMIATQYDTKVFQQLDDLQERLAEQQRALNALQRDQRDIRSRIPGTTLDTWYDEARFTHHFRGSTAELRDRYQDLASRFKGHEPVLELGFGRGEFLELLRENGVDARGVEVDAGLVATARGRGLDVDLAEGGVEYLATVPAASLGGLAMIQVIEHLSPQQVLDVVHLAAEKLRPGGLFVVETVNPMSLNTYARAFWVDPDHVRPVHPAFLEFLCKEAGFEFTIEWRSPVPEDETLHLLTGDDDVSKQLNGNFERINQLLFGPQDYALVAVRT
jgi:2-polyprenyl-3-methyl-5-hydroxy-6-metoxy-1,4-benzoquinol methylase